MPHHVHHVYSGIWFMYNKHLLLLYVWSSWTTRVIHRYTHTIIEAGIIEALGLTEKISCKLSFLPSLSHIPYHDNERTVSPENKHKAPDLQCFSQFLKTRLARLKVSISTNLNWLSFQPELKTTWTTTPTPGLGIFEPSGYNCSNLIWACY